MKYKIKMIFVFLFLSVSNIYADHYMAPPDTISFTPPNGEANDTLEYELLIFDPGFDSWFLRTKKPESFYEQSYLEMWNKQLVIQWNHSLSTRGSRACSPETYLDYRSEIDYGKELNYKLFYYFRYMQAVCRIFSHYPSAWR